MPEIPSEFAWRVEKARVAMGRADCDVLLLDSGESLAWATGYSVSETMYRALFLPREGEPWFVLRELDAVPCREGSWVGDVVGYPDMATPVSVMAGEMARRGFARARIGVDFNSISWNPARMAALSSALPNAAFVDLRGLTDSLRWVKSQAEIAHLARAAAIADRAMAEVAALPRVGLTTREAAATAAASFLRNGADTGETGPIVRGRGDHEFLHGLFRAEALAPGDILHVELIPCVSRYGARLMRPIVVGEPTARQRDVARQLVALQDAQIAAMKPGTVAADVDRIVRQGVLNAGLRAEYANVTAYTLGLYIRTPRSSDFSRVFLPDQTWALEENMVFHVYTSAEGLGFSETVVVTPSGGRRLTATRREIL
ncbi:Xaa-Pro peptidase family protein [Aureimonas sp. ME7]|uniref:M24 family metallopeptidase n=1 Tax=Aureimonas sp. ME7 TaxID=2744252 RepID=UPI0015F7E7B4|nr:Xaa-Pro peptidase family protein [Aureimonas sp. ME7]